MRRMLLLLLPLVVTALSLPMSASGVWGGELDGNRHPMVGAIYADIYPPFDGPRGEEIVCSGSYARPSKDGDHDVFLTRDRGIPFQQNLRRFPLAFIILRARSNKLEHLLPLVPALITTLEKIDAEGYAPGDLYEVTSK